MASDPDGEPQWPPRSPHAALLSTPAGRHRYQRSLDRTSPSPGAKLGHRPDMADEDEDEDEETLQLKLQEIQARLRLKKLQKAKNKENCSVREDGGMGTPQQSTGPASHPGRQTHESLSAADRAPSSASARNQVQVPASPVRKAQPLQQQGSPTRVLLGIDKGRRAKDVSLKRAPNHKGGKDNAASEGRGYLDRSRASTLVASSSLSSETPKTPSFNERLASTRTEEANRAQRQERVQRARTKAFGIGEQEMEQYKKKAVELPDEPLEKGPTFTRDQILSEGRPSSGNIPRSMTTPSLGSHPPTDTGRSNPLSDKPRQGAAAPADVGEDAVGSSSFEPYSCFHLSRRILPHRVLARHVSGKKLLNVKDLLKEVKAPDYSLPDVEQDIVILAIVAKKSDPRTHKASSAKKAEERGKYMVVTLVDLKFELELFLFNSGFTRFWKLTEGTVVAILNPNIMPPPPGRQDTGRFSLVINSDADTILEIGTARDLGYCRSVKKDGDPCGSWVNQKRTRFCEFHSNDAIRKQRSKRMEVNSSGFGGGERRKKFQEWHGTKGKGNDNYDRDTQTQWFATRSHSAADLIDGKDRAPADSKERKEFLQRSLEAKEKEREMMKRLGKVGNAAGREYMQRGGQRAGDTDDGEAPTAKGRADEAARPGAISLGLHRDKDRAVLLGPIKRKRPESSQASSQASSMASSSRSSAFGWGSSLREKLTRMREGEAMRQGGKSPVRKKTRFVTDRGIREAGRESLGNDASDKQAAAAMAEDEEEDELIIV